MTDRASAPKAAGLPARRRPSFLPTALASLACFAVLFEFLAFQLRSGHDPALGATTVASVAPARQGVIERRIVQRRVVHLPPRAPAASTSTTATGTSVVAPSPAPAVPSAPVSAPAPAPAPVTSSS